MAKMQRNQGTQETGKSLSGSSTHASTPKQEQRGKWNNSERVREGQEATLWEEWETNAVLSLTLDLYLIH